jgi:hypothetical protein
MLKYLIERELQRMHSGGWRYTDKSKTTDKEASASTMAWFICSDLKCQFTWSSCIDTWSGRGEIGESSIKYCPKCGRSYGEGK